jgi:DNA-binding MltR family transcriptional regulator
MPKHVLPTPGNLRADTQAFFNVLNNEGDFAAIVVTVAFLDACVASVLKSGLRKSSVTDKLLDPRCGPLGSFAARVDMAYALKLIEKPMYQDLLQYAEIRNMVAHHHVSVSFDDPEISAACQKLNYLLTMKNGDLDEMVFTEQRLPPPRERYKFTAVYLSNLLLVQAEEKARGNAA